MNVAALALYVTFVALVFGVRTAAHRRSTGSSGFHGVSGRPGTAEWWGGVLFVIAMVLGMLAPALAVAGISTPDPDFEVVRTAGLVIGAIGLLLTLGAQSAMGKSWRIGVDADEKTQLVTDGPFALVRNPVFSAMLVFATGLLVAVPTPVSLGAFASLIGALELQTRKVEEPYLLRTQGAQYRLYAARVGRFIPCVGRIRDSGGSITRPQTGV